MAAVDSATDNAETAFCSATPQIMRYFVSNYWLDCPFEVRNEIFSHADALTRHLNWDQGHQTTTSIAPTPPEIWIAALQSNWPGRLNRLPAITGRFTQLPGASILCKFVQTREMLERLSETRLPVPVHEFGLARPALQRNLAHVAMRNCWYDLVDNWNLSDDDKVSFAIQGTHYDYFLDLVSANKDAKERFDDFFDQAAWNGDLRALMSIPWNVRGTESAIDNAAYNGHLDVVKV
jgi:hypothetical protein